LWVRGCWMVSFFFTPIYMFILIFVVSFGTKKGVLASYSWAWFPIFKASFLNLGTLLNPRQLRPKMIYMFQHTALTSRLTVYILTVFWCFFFFFGESLLLLTLNYNTLIDLIPSSFFTLTKTHMIFMTFSSNVYLGDTIFYFILFFTSAAFTFLLTLRYTHFYSYHYATVCLDVFLFSLMIWILYKPFALLVFILMLWLL
jgi:hypothetical protein